MDELKSLLEVVAKIRKDCPWDRRQTHESLKRYLLEEAYELLEAIDKKDDKLLLEELGDMLLQVLMHAQIAKERKAFDIQDVARQLRQKLIDRHPHVFGCEPAEDILKKWEERKAKDRESILDGVPKIMPALMRSQKLQDRASLVGFDFENLQQVFDKIQEEIQELKEAIKEGNKDNIQHEIGDVLTAVVELSRFLKVDAELALQKANDRFERRFRYMEKKAKEMGIELKDMSLKEMDDLWLEAKRFDKDEAFDS
ncbi:nucleoside triphosphate pyrophosphohydrolase [Hydrogenobacter thermophilus]|uniref:nucleoside triphosphate pyrophosphohydrolase n=1 Tax=Hydrogenobacter thermophilus TaxID=940 RepID=UPI0030FCE424